MRYLKLFESFEDNPTEISKICRKYGIRNYTINSDRSIDVDGSVHLYGLDLEKLPLKFNRVIDNFVCRDNKLISLEGSPIEVNGGFYLHRNKLTSFKFAPKIIRGEFWCENNKINSFEHFPNFVKNEFNCMYNPIWFVWILFEDITKIELLNDFDIFRDEHTDTPGIIMDRLNDFLLTIGKRTVEKVNKYNNI